MKKIERARTTLVAFAFLTGAFACKDGPTAPYEVGNPLMELSQTIHSEHFVFHYSSGDFVEPARAEAYHEWAVSFLGVVCPKKIDYFKFKDRQQMYRITGGAATGFADFDNYEVWTYLPWLNHECMHLYSMLVGHPIHLFEEGLAVACQIDPYDNDFEAREKNGEKVHDIVRRYRAEGRLYPLENILDRDRWLSSDFTTTYPQAGSFVRFLIDTHGIERMKEIFRQVGANDSRDEIKQKFLTIYGFSLDQAEAVWLTFIG
ncbi:MAG: hypothetical protein OEW18_04580 [Candidatus Aminicenantes bacterium]|nr:hypothetical protein [Candidatus Aminicenantes bacterium]